MSESILIRVLELTEHLEGMILIKVGRVENPELPSTFEIDYGLASSADARFFLPGSEIYLEKEGNVLMALYGSEEDLEKRNPFYTFQHL